MVLARLKKYILLLFLFIFIGNILFTPISVKAVENPTSPQPSGNGTLCNQNLNGFNSNLGSLQNIQKQVTDIPGGYSNPNYDKIEGLTTQYDTTQNNAITNLTDFAKNNCEESQFNTLINSLRKMNLDYSSLIQGKAPNHTVPGTVPNLNYQTLANPSGSQGSVTNECVVLFETARTETDRLGSLVDNYSPDLDKDGKKWEEINNKVNELTGIFQNLQGKGCKDQDSAKYDDARKKLAAVVQKYQDKVTEHAKIEASTLGTLTTMLTDFLETAEDILLKSEDCGCEKKIAGTTLQTRWFAESICQATCAINKALGWFVEWCFKFLNGASGISQNHLNDNPDKNLFKITGVAHASIVQDLNPNDPGNRQPWIFTMWRFCLSMVNVVVIAVLIFLALVNILRIQVDTYALKKILPTLILGVVLANFSLLICRMLVDFSDVLTRTIFQAFNMSQAEIGTELMNALFLANVGSGIVVATAGIVALFIGPAGWAVFIVLFIIALIIAVGPGILALILGFLLYIRVGVIYFLTAISPLAFMMMILPSTQGLFKQWWSQFARWAFMTPAVYLILAFGILPEKTSALNSVKIIPFMITCAMMYFAVMVPFKLGGAVMAAWGGLGKTLGKAGLKAADYGLGKFTEKTTGKHLSPYTLFKGIKDKTDRGWQRHEAEGSGTGQDIAEGYAGLGSALIHPRSLGTRWNAARDRMNLGARGKAAQLEAYNQDAKGLLTAGVTDAQLLTMAKSPDREQAGAALLAGAQNGLYTNEKDRIGIDNFRNANPGDSTTNLIANEAEKLANKAKVGVVRAPTHEQDSRGQYIKNNIETQISDDKDLLDGIMGNLKLEDQEVQLPIRVKATFPDGIIDKSKLSSTQWAMVRHLQELADSNPARTEKIKQEVPLVADIIEKYKINKIKFDLSSSKIKDKSKAELEKILDDAQTPGGQVFRAKPTDATIMRAVHVKENFDEIKKAIDTSGAEDKERLHKIMGDYLNVLANRDKEIKQKIQNFTKEIR